MWSITSFRGLLPLSTGKVILFYTCFSVHVVGDWSGLKYGLNLKINGLIFTEICLFVDSLFTQTPCISQWMEPFCSSNSYVVVQFIFILHCLRCLTLVTWKIILCESWSVECLSSFSKFTDNAFASVIFRWLSLSCGRWRKRSTMNSHETTGKTLQLTCCQTQWNNTFKSSITVLYLTILQDRHTDQAFKS